MIYIDHPDFTLHLGHVLDELAAIPDGSIDCCVTSPPYWGLRDYDAEGQIGLEPTLADFLAVITDVFDEVRRVLAPHGTLWLNFGDSYASKSRGSDLGWDKSRLTNPAQQQKRQASALRKPTNGDRHRGKSDGLKDKDLIGQPWRVAFALQDAGWWLRSEVIWGKPNAMPESVTDRPTKAHEQLFLLTKGKRYYYDRYGALEPFETSRAPGRTVRETDHYGTVGGNGNKGLTGQLADVRDRLEQEARAGQIKLDPSLPDEAPRGPDGRRQTTVQAGNGSLQHRDGERWPHEGRNKRTVWMIPTEPLPCAVCRVCDAYWPADPPKQHCGVDVVGHFAAFPAKLVADALALACPREVCATCGKPRVRLNEIGYANGAGVVDEDTAATRRAGGVKMMGKGRRLDLHAEHVGWSDCGHDNYRPGRVLDPFMGSGTTALVARALGLQVVGIELNERYAYMTRMRTAQTSMFAEAM